MVRLAEIDERVHPAVTMVIEGVKARCYGLLADADACLRHITLAEQAHTRAKAGTAEGMKGWLGTVATRAHLDAVTGHAAAALGRRTGRDDQLADAKQRLTRAVDEFDRDAQVRTQALCMAQLATLCLETEQLPEGVRWGQMTLDAAAGIRSYRLIEHLVTMRKAATAHTRDPEVKQLMVDIDAVAGQWGGRW